MTDLLLPRTDAGVAVQLILFAAVAATTMTLLRRNRDWLILAAGVSVLGLALFGVRALH